MPTFTNQATLAMNGLTLSSNTVTGELLGALTVTKNTVSADYALNNAVAYVITLVNNGTTDVTGLTLADNLGAYTVGSVTVVPLTYVTGTILYYINGELQTAPSVTASPFSITGISVPAGGNATIAYSATPNSYAPLASGSTITNTVTVSGGGLATALTANTSVAAESGSELSITKAMNPTTVSTGDTLTYTFIIQNTGNQAVVATDNAIINDTLNPILNPLTVTFNGTTWAATTNYTYATDTGVFSTVAGQITVPAATYTQASDGTVTTTPGVSTLVLTGTVV